MDKMVEYEEGRKGFRANLIQCNGDRNLLAEIAEVEPFWAGALGRMFVQGWLDSYRYWAAAME